MVAISQVEPLARRLANRLADVGVGEVDQAVSAQHDIHAGKGVRQKIELPEAYTAIRGGKRGAVAADELRDDVCADITIQVEVGAAHPLKIPAGEVKERPYPQVLQQDGKFSTQMGGGLVFRAEARARCFCAPQFGLPDLGEQWLGRQIRVIGCALLEALMGQYRWSFAHSPCFLSLRKVSYAGLKGC